MQESGQFSKGTERLCKYKLCASLIKNNYKMWSLSCSQEKCEQTDGQKAYTMLSQKLTLSLRDR